MANAKGFNLPGSVFDPLALWSGRYLNFDEMRLIKPFWMRVDLIWPAPRTLNSISERQTRTTNNDILIIGAASSLLFSEIKIQYANADITLSNEYVPIWALSGGYGDSRQPYYWQMPLPIPAKTELTISAQLKGGPSGGPIEGDGTLIFHCIKLERN